VATAAAASDPSTTPRFGACGASRLSGRRRQSRSTARSTKLPGVMRQSPPDSCRTSRTRANRRRNRPKFASCTTTP